MRISDHALVRWLERSHGIDMDWFRQKLREEVEAAIPKVVIDNVTSVQIDGLLYVIEDGVLVTVRPKHYCLQRARFRENTEKTEGAVL